jgi:NAD-dependent SIR2 family protein deacetylase
MDNNTAPDKIENKLLTEDLRIYLEYGVAKRSDNGPINENREDQYELCKEECRKYYTNQVKYSFNNLVFLSGAGTSIKQGADDSKGKTMKGLWNDLSYKYNNKFNLEDLKAELNIENENLEDLISVLDQFIFYNCRMGDKEKVERYERYKDIIYEHIFNECNLTLYNDSNIPNSHEILLDKLIQLREGKARTKIFTTNYDLLFEQAAEKQGIRLIDGFDSALSNKFDVSIYQQDLVLRDNQRTNDKPNFLTKVAHLYKLHGSVNWFREFVGKKDNGSVIKIPLNPSYYCQYNYKELSKITELYNDSFNSKNLNDTPTMIYPESSKFESSYESPFIESMSKLMQEISIPNTLLIISGFSFADKHISRIIFNAIRSNPSLIVLVFAYDFREFNDNNPNDNCKELYKMASTNSQVTIIEENFDDLSRNLPQVRDKHDLLPKQENYE